MTRSQEMTFTTPASPAHPVFPVAPNQYNPTEPDTSAYTVVSMVPGPTECVAAANVAAPSGNTSWSGNVLAGYTVQQVLNVVGYGTILDFSQGAICRVPDTNTYNSGYWFMPKLVDPLATSIDDPHHRWIIIQTHQSSATDFPPSGFRTSSSWDSKAATFVAEQPTTTVWTSGQHFDTYQDGPAVSPGNVHHYLIRHVTLTVNTLASGNYGAYISFGGTCTSQFVQNTPPSYFVIDQVHMVGAPLSSAARSQIGMMGCPNHLVIRNSALEGFDAPGAWSQGIYFSDWSQGFYTIDNNLIQGVGQNIYFESNGYTIANHDDIVLTHNYLNWPLSTLKGNPAWDGRERLLRNQFETKRSRRILLAGNIVDGQWAFQNEGSAIFLSGNNELYSGETGVTDANIYNNIIRNSANVLNCLATRGTSPGPPDNSVSRRVRFYNNLAYNLGRHLYNYPGAGGSLYSAYLITAPGCQDFVVQHNTFGFTDADSGDPGFQYAPVILGVGSGAQLSEGFYFQNNIAHFSVGNPYTGITSDASQVEANFPRLPLIASNLVPSAILNSAMVTLDGTSASGTPNGVWGQNVMIGGTFGASGLEPWPDLGNSTSYYAAQMPPGDIWAIGSTMSQRQLSAGLLRVGSGDYTCTPTSQNPADSKSHCSSGADVPSIRESAGIVESLSVSPAASSATVTYTAPDTRACSVDYGTGVTGSGFPIYSSRMTDTGGTSSRSLVLSGLTPATIYNYHLMCYFDQGSGATVPDGATTLGTFLTSKLVTGTKAATTLTLASSPNPSTFTQNVTVIATISPPAATGTVVFNDGPTPLATITLTGGTASYAVSLLSPGTHSLTAVYGGDANNSGSSSSVLTQVVNKASQTITCNPVQQTLAYGGPPLIITCIASSGQPVNVSSTTAGVCTVAGSTVTIVSAGNCTISASQAGNASYVAALTVFESLIVAQASQTISFGAVANVTFGSPPFTISATASSGLPVSFASTTPSVCTVSGNTVTVLSAGVCSLSAAQPGNTNYLAAPAVSKNVNVAQASQTISSGAVANVTFGSPPFTISATASSGLPVSFASTTTSVCTVSGTTVTVTSAGTCSVSATQAGNTNYLAAPAVSQSFVVLPLPTISSLNPAIVTAGGQTFTLTVNGSNFVPGAIVNWGSTALTSTIFVSAAQLTASVNASQIASAGSTNVTVLNPGSGTSAPAAFTVQAASSGGGSGGGGGGGGGGIPAGSPLTFIPASLTFSLPVNGSASCQTVTLQEFTQASRAPSFTTNASTNQGFGWLSVSPSSGTLPQVSVSSGQYTFATTVRVCADPSGIAAGSMYTGNVGASAAGTAQLPVTLNVTSAPTVLTPSPSSVNLVLQQGAASLPPAQIISVLSTPPGASFAATASTSSGGNWLTVSPASGTTPGNISVTVNPANLSPSATPYSGQITLTPATGSLVTVGVSLTITPKVAPVLSLSNSTESFALSQTSSPTTGEVTVSNTGGGTLQFAASASSATGNWLQLTGTGSGSATSASPASVGFTVIRPGSVLDCTAARSPYTMPIPATPIPAAPIPATMETSL